MDDIAIKVDSVSKIFKLPLEKQSSIKSKFVSIFRSKKGYELQAALKDVSLDVKKGEFFGIVGRNGSGKSTLLKLLAGIYIPTKGAVHTNGTLTPFIELGVGFNPELTGRENVYLNGALLGFSRKEMKSMYEDIVEFAELEKFMDQKLKNYSSGMQVRLAFSIAIRAKSDILLIDEVLAVGDEAFQKKCREYFRGVKDRQQTVILVTHDMKTIIDYCDRAMLLDKGRVVLIKEPKTTAEAYEEINRTSLSEEPSKMLASKDFIKNGVSLNEVLVRDPATKEKKVYFKYSENVEILVKYKLLRDISNAIIDIGVKLGEEGSYYFYTTSLEDLKKINGKKGETITLSCRYKNIFHPGTYYIATSLYEADTQEVYARNRQAAKYETGNLPSGSLVYLDHKLNIRNDI